MPIIAHASVSMFNKEISALLFSYNNHEDLVRLVKRIAKSVDEVVIIDSSDNKEFSKNRRLASDKVRIYRALPLGYVEPLRTYGLARTRFDWIFYLDLDETPSHELLNDLHDIVDRGKGGFVIKRDDVGSSSYHMRLFRKDLVKYKGYIHEIPELKGETAILDGKRYFIKHREKREASYKSAFERYVRVETVEGPLSYTYMRARIKYLAFLPHEDTAMSPPAFYFFLCPYLVVWYFRTLVNSIRSMNFSLLNDGAGVAKYRIAVYNYYKSLPPSTQKRYTYVALAMLHSGGPIKYLQLDDITHVEALTKANTNWGNGFSNYENLLTNKYKARH